MCICLPNGKFYFKFPRTHTVIGKKDDKSKPKLSLIPELPDEDVIENKSSYGHKNGVKRTSVNQIQQQAVNNDGHGRHFSRDSQLPPVPDASNLTVIELNSPRKSMARFHSNSTKVEHFRQRQSAEDYGYACNSDIDLEDDSAISGPFNKQCNPLTTPPASAPRDIGPIYSHVRRHGNQPLCQVTNTEQYSDDNSDINYLYSSIVKKEFNSLRRPMEPRSSIRDYSYPSLQSLDNQVPSVPVRMYKLSELVHIADESKTTTSDMKLKKVTPTSSKSNSLRRFSQPNSVTTELDPLSQFSEESQRDVDVLRNLQSQYNTPPTKRASLADICHLQMDVMDSSDIARYPSGTISNIPVSTNASRPSNYRDLSLGLSSQESLGKRVIGRTPLDLETSTAAHVYEGLYEPLYYSSGDHGRATRRMDSNIESTGPRGDPSTSPLPYLGQDNYLSITDNPLFVHSSNTHPSVMAANDAMKHTEEHSSGIYATTGSEVYAEIPDVYLSKHYEELPDPRSVTKSNNGKCCPNSPGTLRVLLEIQSFRHMDSDVDVCSRSITPLCPLARSITSTSKHLQASQLEHISTISSSTLTRHPWYLPAQSEHNYVTNNGHLASPTTAKTALTSKPKLPPNHLAIMTPLMERSMEDSSLFLDSNRSNEHEISSLYDLFKMDQKYCDASALRNGSTRGNMNDQKMIYPSFSSLDKIDTSQQL